jgi:hypothetical protein
MDQKLVIEIGKLRKLSVQDLRRKYREIEQEMDRVRLRLGDSACKQGRIVADLLETFDDIWGALMVDERRELLHLLIKRVTVDIDAGDLRVVFRDLTADFDDAGDDPPAGKEVATRLEDRDPLPRVHAGAAAGQRAGAAADRGKDELGGTGRGVASASSGLTRRDPRRVISWVGGCSG